MRRMKKWLALAVPILVSCQSNETRQQEAPGRGRLLVGGEISQVLPSPNGEYMAYLERCIRPSTRGVPPDAASCNLKLVSRSDGEVRLLAEEVPNLGLGYAWIPAKSGPVIVALTDYDYSRGIGTLRYAGGPSGLKDVVKLAEEVSFYSFSLDSAFVGFVSRGTLSLFRSDEGRTEAVQGLDRVATFDFNPALGRGNSSSISSLLAARRPASAGGDLVLVNGNRKLERVSSSTGDYRFAPDGKGLAFTSRRGNGADLYWASIGPGGAGAPRIVGRDVQGFSFSHSGSRLAFVQDVAPGKPGDLVMDGERESKKIAPRVGDFRWATRAERIAWLQNYDQRIRAGKLGVGGPDLDAKVLGTGVRDYDISADGLAIAFVEHVTTGTYSVDLRLSRIAGDAETTTVARGVFGFEFSPDGKVLYYRTNCVGQAEACDLYALPVEDMSSLNRGKLLAEGMKGFEFAPGRSDRLIVTWVRNDAKSLDMGIIDKNGLTRIDTRVVPGSMRFFNGSNGLTYLVTGGSRPGLYVADLPSN